MISRATCYQACQQPDIFWQNFKQSTQLDQTMDQPTNQLSDFVAPQTSLLAQAGWCQNGSEASRCLRRQRPQESQESPRSLPLMFCRWKQGYIHEPSVTAYLLNHTAISQTLQNENAIHCRICCTNSSEVKQLVPNKNLCSSFILYSIPSILYIL